MGEFGRLYEKQYAVALFNKMRYDMEGGGGPQPQLLHRKVPLNNKSIFSGALFQYLEENKKWRNGFLFIPDSFNINYYENKQAHDRGLHPKGTINCAGYRVLTSMEEYLELLNTSLPGVKAKVGTSPFLKCATQFPLILWHPYARHYVFCVVTEKEQQKWNAVFQDCVRHSNNGLSEECKVQTPAFTDTVRLYRQAHGHYGTWDMMCGMPQQILANLVMETLLPELKDLITPKLKGKMHERQRNWMLISDAVYGLVQSQTQAQYEAIVQSCEAGSPPLENTIRTDMDQIISSKEHVTSKIRALVLPKADKLLKVSIQPYISSILEALMEPTSRGFFEVRDLFFRELVDMSKNLLNDGNKEKLGEHMEKISMLAFHPVKMQSCYERVETLSLEGLQQRFDVSSPSVFVQRAQILIREQMDDAVYTFEQLLHQSLEGQEGEDLCKTIQRCQDRVIKKFDYDSSTVRKKFFREALLQIFIPYMLKQLSPSCSAELPHFQELIFEDFSRFILVENIFEEVVLHTVMKDIMMAVKEAAVQRRHNLYRDSIVLNNSDPNLLLLGENPPIDWAGGYGGGREEVDGEDEGQVGDTEAHKRHRMKQVVSMIQLEGTAHVLPNESTLEVAAVDDYPEDEAERRSDTTSTQESEMKVPNGTKKDVNRNEFEEKPPALTNRTALQEEETPAEKPLQETGNKSAMESAIQEIDNTEEEEERELGGLVRMQKAAESSLLKEDIANKEVEFTPNYEYETQLNQVEMPALVTNRDTPSGTKEKPLDSPSREVEAVTPSDQQEKSHISESNQDSHSEQSTDSISPSQQDNSGFQSPTNEAAVEELQTAKEECNGFETGEDTGKGECAHMDHQ
ncbi:protein Niban 2-like isoform X2 [Myxocyprinus asiaticus]|nr:protein Niban 2-like isoform X2 [Myxocyprinus asiaticus]XP_051515884.1 protein Niban 2-like isoform X2 [Myxocyprinus asiaticus]XP_051515894.1 protein Niban 2-like isoform X2 [Myxocyprinus asiaticus]